MQNDSMLAGIVRVIVDVNQVLGLNAWLLFSQSSREDALGEADNPAPIERICLRTVTLSGHCIVASVKSIQRRLFLSSKLD